MPRLITEPFHHMTLFVYGLLRFRSFFSTHCVVVNTFGMSFSSRSISAMFVCRL